MSGVKPFQIPVSLNLWTVTGVTVTMSEGVTLYAQFWKVYRFPVLRIQIGSLVRVCLEEKMHRAAMNEQISKTENQQMKMVPLPNFYVGLLAIVETGLK